MLSILELLITPFISKLRDLVGGQPGGFVQASVILGVCVCVCVFYTYIRFIYIYIYIYIYMSK